MSSEIYTAEEIRKRLYPVFKRHNIRKAVLFGSYGKGKADARSDVDLLVDSDLKGLRFVGFMEEIRSAVDKEVDVFDVTHIEKGSRIEKEIEKTGALLYEK